MNLRDRFNRFMQGRYGQDEFSSFLLIVTIVMLILETFFRSRIFSVLTFVLLIYSWFRILSRNIPARYAENQKFLGYRDRLLAFFKRTKDKSAELKDYHIYRCPKCGQKIRIPRGKGKIVVTCPKCRTEFRKRS